MLLGVHLRATTPGQRHRFRGASAFVGEALFGTGARTPGLGESSFVQTRGSVLNQLLEFKGLGDSGPAVAQVLLAEDEAPAFLLFLETSKLHFSGPLTGQPLPTKKSL